MARVGPHGAPAWPREPKIRAYLSQLKPSWHYAAASLKSVFSCHAHGQRYKPAPLSVKCILATARALGLNLAFTLRLFILFTFGFPCLPALRHPRDEEGVCSPRVQAPQEPTSSLKDSATPDAGTQLVHRATPHKTRIPLMRSSAPSCGAGLCVAPRGPRPAGALRPPNRAPTAAAPRGRPSTAPFKRGHLPRRGPSGEARPVRSNYGKSGKGAAQRPLADCCASKTKAAGRRAVSVVRPRSAAPSGSHGPPRGVVGHKGQRLRD